MGLYLLLASSLVIYDVKRGRKLHFWLAAVSQFFSVEHSVSYITAVFAGVKIYASKTKE